MFPLKDNIPTDRFPVVTVALIVLNLLVFGWQLTFSGDQGSASSPELAQVGVSERDQLNLELGAIPRELTEPGTYCLPAGFVGGEVEEACGPRSEFEAGGEFGIGLAQAPWWVTVFTSMFMHGGILHIAGNMLFLWVFGNNIEDSMGRPRFVAFYLLSGAAAVYTQSLIDPTSTVPTIGASGAVAGVLGAYLLLYPRAKVLTVLFVIFLFTIIELPAMLLLGIWFLLQFLPAVGQVATPDIAGEGGGVAYLAHVGGFIFGLAAIKLFATRVKEPPTEPPYPVY